MSGKIHEKYKFVTVVVPATYDSDTAILSSDNTNGVPIAGARGVLFLVAGGAVTATASYAFQIAYASNGTASDASTSSNVWTSSDCLVTLDSDNPNVISGVYVDIASKGLSDAAGKLYVTNAVSAEGAGFAIIAVIDPANARFPVTQETTFTVANGT